MNKKNIITTFGISLLAAPALFGCASNQTQTDFDKMRDAYKEYIMTSNQKTIDANKDKSAVELIEELKKESDQMIEELGPKFFKELHQTLRQKELEAHAKRCKSRDDDSAFF